jgi:hypothetical protein
MNWRFVRRLVLYSLLFVLYLISTVPVGLFIYSVKTEVGFDMFRDGGFHAYMRCLSTSFPVGRTKVAVAPATERLPRCEATTRPADVDSPVPAPASAPAPAGTFEDASRPIAKRSREGAKEQCMLEAARLGKAASLWCAGL